MLKKYITLGIIVLFFETWIISGLAQTSESSSQTTINNWLYVGGSGPGNYSRIQDAIDNASANDTIFVFNDSSPYYEFLKINRPIHLVGEEPRSTIIDGSSEPKIVVSITADNVHLSNFTIINIGDEAIFLTANYTTIFNNIIGPNISGWSGKGVRLLNANNNKIIDNEIAHTFDSIQVFNSHHNRIYRNFITSSWLYGIWLSESTQNNISSNMIETSSQVAMPGSYVGIRLISSNDNYLFDNCMLSWDEDCVTGMMLRDSSDNQVINNEFLDCGFAWHGSYENVVHNNFVNNAPLIYQIGQPHLNITKAGQIVLIQCNDSSIHNVQISNTPKAIDLMLSNNCHLFNCTCLHNQYGINLESSTQNEVTNNAIVGNKHGIYIGDESIHTVVTNNTVQDSLYLGIYSNAAFTRIERNHVLQNTRGIMIGGVFALQNSIIDNNVTDNCNGIVLFSFGTKVTRNLISKNINGVCIEGGSSFNHITSNEIDGNDCGVNITFAPSSLRSISNWIQKNNFVRNNVHAWFDSSVRNHWIRNFWEGDWLPPHRINGMQSFYEVHPWTGAIIWETHIPWMAFDWFPSQKPYDT